MNFNVNFSSSFGTQKKGKQGLTPQEEYWLDRILRNYGTQIFIVIVLFFTLIISSVVYSIFNQGPTDRLNPSSNRIEINGSRIIISQ